MRRIDKGYPKAGSNTRGAIKHREVLQWVAIWDIAAFPSPSPRQQSLSPAWRARRRLSRSAIGTQDTTTNTATAGTIIRELHLLGEISAQGRQIREYQVRARLAELHIRSARHQRHDGEQASVRHDGRLSADRERLHFRKQSGKQEPADRGRRLQPARFRQRDRRAQGLALLRTFRPQGQTRQRSLRLRRARHGPEGDAGQGAGRRTTSSS